MHEDRASGQITTSAERYHPRRVVWTNELIGGIIFILWWVAMWFMDILRLAPVEGVQPGDGDVGDGIAMGYPLFVLGIVFIRRWHKGRNGRAVKKKPAEVAS